MQAGPAPVAKVSLYNNFPVKIIFNTFLWGEAAVAAVLLLMLFLSQILELQVEQVVLADLAEVGKVGEVLEKNFSH